MEQNSGRTCYLLVRFVIRVESPRERAMMFQRVLDEVIFDNALKRLISPDVNPKFHP